MGEAFTIGLGLGLGVGTWAGLFTAYLLAKKAAKQEDEFDPLNRVEEIEKEMNEKHTLGI